MRSLVAICLLFGPGLALAQRTVGTVNAAAPTYVDGSAAPISLTTAGGLRVNCVNCGSGGGVDQGAPGNAATPWFVKLTDGTTAVIVTVGGAIKVDGSGVTQPVSGTVGISGTVPVSGTFYQATQPISAASLPTHGVTGTFWQSTQPVSIASMPTTPVTGTFYQATQPVSVASVPTHGVTGTFWQATQPVSGTFWQATQPVSGTVTANAGSGTMAVSLASAPTTPVTGTFWQATQPVSVASMPSTPVTGTFFQATQPVSVASMPSTPVTGTFWQGTQPVSIATAPTTTVAGLSPSGAARTIAVDEAGVLYMAPSRPTNPFLPRCNFLRKTNCNP